MFGGLGKKFTDLEAALAVAFPSEGRAERGTGLTLGGDVVSRECLAVVFIEGDLAVEGVDLGGAAVREDVNHALGLAGQRGLAGGQRTERVYFDLSAAEFLLEQRSHGDAAEAHADSAEELTAGAEGE